MWTEGPSDPPGGEGSGAPADTGDVTWLHCRFPSSFWTTPEGVFDPVAADTEWVSTVGSYTWNSMYMAAEVQVWLDTPAVNLGWAIVGNESVVKTTKRFDSRENLTPANQPVLLVVYATPTWTSVPTSADNTLYEDSTGSLSNGAGMHMFVGRTSDPVNSIRRTLLWFNLFAVIGVNSNIFDTRILLHVSAAPAAPQLVSMHRGLTSWAEGTSDASGTEEQGAPASGSGATWLRYESSCNGCRWGSPGGDFDSIPLTAAMVGTVAGFYEWRSDSLVSWVQDLVSNPAGNWGLVALGGESMGGTIISFDTREHPDSAVRPVLQVAWNGGCLIEVDGDSNGSGTITAGDIIYLVNKVLKSGPDPLPCLANGDVNCSGTVTSADIISMVMYVFKGGAPPCSVIYSSLIATCCVTEL